MIQHKDSVTFRKDLHKDANVLVFMPPTTQMSLECDEMLKCNTENLFTPRTSKHNSCGSVGYTYYMHGYMHH